MAFQFNQVHILLVPLMTQSHLIPFTDMAKQLAQRGPTVTILMTPLNSLRFQTFVSEQTSKYRLKIQFLVLPLPCRENGLPQGCENMDSIPSPDLVPNFFSACKFLQEPLEKWVLEKMEFGAKPSCIVSDFCLPWTENIAIKFNIPRFVFHGTSIFSAVCNFRIVTSKVLERIKSDSDPFLVPDIPDEIYVTRGQLPRAIRQSPGESLSVKVNEFKAAELSADGILVNSFEELESKYLNEYIDIKKKKIWFIGPVSHMNRDEILDSVTAHDNCSIKWLNARTKPGSVVYACFGSLTHFSYSQLKELAIGLESSNRPFIWVIRKDDFYSTRRFEEWLEEENFEERVKERGLVFRGWAPQVSILNHPAVGGFLTHCGWNSTLDGVSAGRPMITWPMFAEQFHNENLIVKLLKIGVRVGVKETVENHRRDEDNDVQKGLPSFVTRDNIKKAIEDLMDEGDEGEERRRRAKEAGEMANRVVEGGSSFLNVSLFIQHISEELKHQS
ncbi:UDP-glucuronosyl/UDP-glucosyltransferase [Parasponia andersonii]|uniref:Glycosyltransferase n=1 Tax=Parasponia andersonii TaxID=3476 RepID=A0A2P5BX44_PARAD|nr:UDP-glucuronosyl/UDP-glucosyltransferase [Parasponia andersonii]